MDHYIPHAYCKSINIEKKGNYLFHSGFFNLIFKMLYFLKGTCIRQNLAKG